MATHDEALAPPDRRALWRWVAESVRPVAGWILLALGAVALFLGWYGVSGQSLTAKQLPYLVSGGLTGLALVVIGAVLLATADVQRQIGRLNGIERKVDDLYALLVLEPPPAAAATAATAATGTTEPAGAGDRPGEAVALPTGTTFHRPSCALVAGKEAAGPVDDDSIAARSLQPCPVCEPGRPTESP